MAADQPVEHAVKGRSLQAELLAEGLELAHDARLGAIEDVDGAIIDVARLSRFIGAIGGNRGQRRSAEIPFDVERNAAILGLALESPARADVDVAAVW